MDRSQQIIWQTRIEFYKMWAKHIPAQDVGRRLRMFGNDFGLIDVGEESGLLKAYQYLSVYARRKTKTLPFCIDAIRAALIISVS
jgi:hypothetical protein